MVRTYKTLEFGRASGNEVWRSYIARAASKGLAWELTRCEFDALISRSCVYCSRPPGNIKNNGRNYGHLFYNGIDRVDNRLGYIKSNVVSCCAICNRAKGTLTTQEFDLWIHDLMRVQHGLPN